MQVDVEAVKVREGLLGPGILAVADGLKVELAGIPDGRFELVLRLPPAPSEDAYPAVVHISKIGRKSIEFGLWDAERNEISLAAGTFSERFPAWLDAQAIADSLGSLWDKSADSITGRTDPPQCRNNPPTWLQVEKSELSSIHVCLQDLQPPQAGMDGELLLKSNRNTAQAVVLPSLEKKYVWVEDQGDILRQLLPFLADLDPAYIVVLPGGDTMSVGGFGQPQFDSVFELRSQLNYSLIIFNAVAALFGGLDVKEQDLAVMVAIANCVSDIADFQPSRMDLLPSGYRDSNELISNLIDCSISAVANPEVGEAFLGEALTLVEAPETVKRDLMTSFKARAEKMKKTARRLARVLALGGAVTFSFDAIRDSASDGLLRMNVSGSAQTTLATVSPVDAAGQESPGYMPTSRLQGGRLLQ